MGKLAIREAGRLGRHRRIRKKVSGSPERPRLSLHRSHLHLEVQIIDDLNRRTLVHCTTRQGSAGKTDARGGDLEAAKRLGERVAQEAKKAGIKKVVLDRGGYPYHGRVKALTEAVRSQGVEV